LEGSDVVITASAADIDSILKLNGFKFAGATLKIEPMQTTAAFPTKKEEAEMSQDAKNLQEKIKGILSTRYDVNLKLLNLSALGQDAELVKMGMFDAQNRVSKLFPALMKVCDRIFTSAQQKRDAIVTVTLTDNGIDGVSAITTLAQTFPDLLNLDLSKNKFADLRSLEGKYKSSSVTYENLLLKPKIFHNCYYLYSWTLTMLNQNM
jgi:nuclear RNA export factor